MRRTSKFRLKNYAVPSFLEAGGCLSRHEAIQQIQQLMNVSSMMEDALRLIELFNIEPEELSEAGLSYEQLKVLEKQTLFL